MATQWPARTAARARNRERLLEAAQAVGRERGYRGTSLDAVASRAGLTTGAIYSIFGGKRQLFLEALRSRFAPPSLTDVVPLGTPMPEVLRTYGLQRAAMLADVSLCRDFAIALELGLAAFDDPVAEEDARRDFQVEVEALAKQLATFGAHVGATPRLPWPDLAVALSTAISGLTVARIQLGRPSDETFGYVAASLWGDS